MTGLHGTTLESTELLRAIRSFTDVCRSSLHAEVLGFIHLEAMEVIGTPEFNYLDGGVNTFGNIVYLFITTIARSEWKAIYRSAERTNSHQRTNTCAANAPKYSLTRSYIVSLADDPESLPGAMVENRSKKSRAKKCKLTRSQS